MGHAELLIELVQEHRYQSGLPVMAVDDVRVLAGLPQELHRRAGKERVAQHIVRKAVNDAAVEEVVAGVRFDEEAFSTMNEAEIHRAMDGPLVPGHPEVLVDLMQLEDVVVAQAVVLGQDDLDMVATDGKLATDAEDHVRKPAYLGHRRHFWRDMHNVETGPVRVIDLLGRRLRRRLGCWFRCSLWYRLRFWLQFRLQCWLRLLWLTVVGSGSWLRCWLR